MDQNILPWLESVIDTANSYRKQLASSSENNIEIYTMLGRVMGKAMDLRNKLRGN